MSPYALPPTRFCQKNRFHSDRLLEWPRRLVAVSPRDWQLRKCEIAVLACRAAQRTSGIALQMLKMSRLPCCTSFMCAHRLVTLDAATLLLTSKNSFVNRHDPPSHLALHLACNAFRHIVLSNQGDDSITAIRGPDQP